MAKGIKPRCPKQCFVCRVVARKTRFGMNRVSLVGEGHIAESSIEPIYTAVTCQMIERELIVVMCINCTTSGITWGPER